MKKLLLLLSPFFLAHFFLAFMMSGNFGYIFLGQTKEHVDPETNKVLWEETFLSNEQAPNLDGTIIYGTSSTFKTMLFSILLPIFLIVYLIIIYFINISGKIWERKFIIDKIFAIIVMLTMAVGLTIITRGEGMQSLGVIGSVIIIGIFLFVWKTITGIAKKKGAK